MGICYHCGKEVDMPYECSYCGLTFCKDHRLPEQHNCIAAPDRDWGTFKELKTAREGYPREKQKSITETIKENAIVIGVIAVILAALLILFLY